MSTVLVYLAIYQDVQQKVFDEIEEFLGSETELTYENMNQLKYLEMVLKETLRLFTPIPISAREVVEPLDIGTGKPLAKGTRILLLNHLLHRREDFWGKNANNFDPDNFTPENISKRNAYAYMPFGAG